MGQQSNRLLCIGCHKNHGVTTDGKVDCGAAGQAVEPVSRKPRLRYEDCFHRRVADLGRPVRSPEILQAINLQAVLLKQNFPNEYHSGTVAIIEERLVAEMTQ